MIFNRFRAMAEATGNTEVRRFDTRTAGLEFIKAFLKEEKIEDHPGSYAVWADSPFLKGLDLKPLEGEIPGLKFQVTRALAKNARIGITQMEWGLASTGTLAQDATDAGQRLASSLPVIHIALLPSRRIVADLPDLMMKMDPVKSPYITLTTGPSKTADIERVLAIGVHGPERLVIVCVDDLGIEE